MFFSTVTGIGAPATGCQAPSLTEDSGSATGWVAPFSIAHTLGSSTASPGDDLLEFRRRAPPHIGAAATTNHPSSPG